MQSKIVPHLWFEKEAKEAVRFYVSLFPDSAITHEQVLSGTPSGDCDILSFKLWGNEFQAISAGPYFTFKPSVSFIIHFDPVNTPDPRALLDSVWARFSEGGTVMMPLDEYPFSKRYGWIKDKYGLSWQLFLGETMNNSEEACRPTIYPSLMFVKENAGKAEEAMKFYMSVFKNSKEGMVARWRGEHKSEREGTVMHADFRVENMWFAVGDSADPVHDFDFKQSVSFLVNCDSQEEIDEYWGKLSAVKEAEQCGWLTDKFGIPWQIVPRAMEDMMRTGTPEQISRVTAAFMKMKKFEIEPLKKAFAGEDDSPRPNKQTKTS